MPKVRAPLRPKVRGLEQHPRAGAPARHRGKEPKEPKAAERELEEAEGAEGQRIRPRQGPKS
jgi:hypothetical protein